MKRVIGVDFGTTNSVVAALAHDGNAHSRGFDWKSEHFEVFRTVLCFWSEIEKGRHFLRQAAGPAAIEAYLDDPIESVSSCR